jgi:hypothetical protein
MGFIAITFKSDYCLTEIVQQLCRVQGVTTLGDWHDYRLLAVIQSGLGLASAPARSVEKDRLKHGEATHIQLALSDGNRAVGQVKQCNLLLSCKKVPANTLKNEANVQALVNTMFEIGREVEVEMG